MHHSIEAANAELAQSLEAAWESWLSKSGMAFDGEAVLLFCKALDDMVPPLKSHLFNIYFHGLNANTEDEQGSPAGLFR